MSDPGNKETRQGGWIGTISLVAVHTIAFGMLYLMVVQMNWTFRDFFSELGAKPTPRFEAVSRISDYVAFYTFAVLMVIAVHLFFVFRLSRRASHWASAYSHSTLLCMGFVGFIWTAWAIDTMIRVKPGVADPPSLVAVAEH